MLAELEELEERELEEKLLDVGPSVELPSVPSAVPSEPSRGNCGCVRITLNVYYHCNSQVPHLYML